MSHLPANDNAWLALGVPGCAPILVVAIIALAALLDLWPS